MSKIKILMADDHALIREGLKRMLGFEEDLTILGDASNGKELLDLLKMNEPDIVLLDMNMPVQNGLETLKILKNTYSSIKVIMLTVENDRNTIHKAIESGADGYVLKDSAGEEIVSAIKTVFLGGQYIDKTLVNILFSAIREKEEPEENILSHLTERELQILSKISKGMSNKEIGESLYISEKTVKNYATKIFRKINVDDRVQATIMALRNNIEIYIEQK
ncbi:MAG: response regulator [Clostridium sp.]